VPPAVAIEHRVRKLGSGCRASQQQSAATHVSATDKRRGIVQAIAEWGAEEIDVLSGCEASQEDDSRVGWKHGGETSQVALQRRSVASLLRSDIHPSEFLDHGRRQRHIGGLQPARRRNDVHSRGERGWRAAERGRVSQLSAKVETAHEGEGLAERQRALPQSYGGSVR
jgi:hypothetical protein